MNVKEHLAKAIREQEIKFTEDGHTYTRKGEFFTGVTTILKVRHQPFLMWWTVKLMHQVLQDKQDFIKKATPEDYLKLLDNAKKAHTKKSDKAKDSGTLAHAFIEKYVKAKISGKKDTLTLPRDEEARNSCNSFLEWVNRTNIIWVASEVVVGSLEHKFAGTLDALAYMEGGLTIIDFKTSSKVSEDAFLQTAGYQICLEEMKIYPDQRLIMRFPKDGKKAESVFVPTPIEFDKEIFLYLREVHRWELYVKNINI